jgi:hypothetical protein
MPDVFPAELISEIVSHLDPANIQDLRTLTACNLVSLSFSAASGGVLFHTICVSPHLTVHGFYERNRTASNYAAVIKLRSILSKSPHLAELVRVIYLDDLDRDAYSQLIQFEKGKAPPLLKMLWNVQSLYIFGWAALPAYNYVTQNLECFPKLCTLAIAYEWFSTSGVQGTYQVRRRVYDASDHCRHWPLKPVVGRPGVPVDGTENWCLTRKLGADAISREWTLSAVSVSNSSLNRFSASCPEALWSIPHLTIPITVEYVSRECTSLLLECPMHPDVCIVPNTFGIRVTFVENCSF